MFLVLFIYRLIEQPQLISLRHYTQLGFFVVQRLPQNDPDATTRSKFDSPYFNDLKMSPALSTSDPKFGCSSNTSDTIIWFGPWRTISGSDT